MNEATSSRRLALLHFYLPRLMADDGSTPEHWTRARTLFHLADNVLQQHYHHYQKIQGVDSGEVIAAIHCLKPMRVRLTDIYQQDLTHLAQYGDWLRLKASVLRVMPLVEQLLNAGAY